MSNSQTPKLVKNKSAPKTTQRIELPSTPLNLE
jgi:hypothetical protein